jgi:hypothetical protein
MQPMKKKRSQQNRWSQLFNFLNMRQCNTTYSKIISTTTGHRIKRRGKRKEKNSPQVSLQKGVKTSKGHGSIRLFRQDG